MVAQPKIPVVLPERRERRKVSSQQSRLDSPTRWIASWAGCISRSDAASFLVWCARAPSGRKGFRNGMVATILAFPAGLCSGNLSWTLIGDRKMSCTCAINWSRYALSVLRVMVQEQAQGGSIGTPTWTSGKAPAGVAGARTREIPSGKPVAITNLIGQASIPNLTVISFKMGTTRIQGGNARLSSWEWTLVLNPRQR